MSICLVDSGAFLALLDVGDTHHAAAADFALANKTTTFYVPETIFFETKVLVKARLGAQAAIELGERIMKSTRFQILYLTPDDRLATCSPG